MRGLTYSTGVIAYSLGSYCEGIAENPNSDAQMLAAETAVYGYYAERYFDALSEKTTRAADAALVDYYNSI